MPEISVIMGVYNELNKDILMEAVNSILHQTFEDFEFIIYDDRKKIFGQISGVFMGWLQY